jgi:hypothetical protein
MLLFAAVIGSADDTDAIQILVLMPNSTKITLNVEAADTIEQVKAKIQDREAVPPDRQTLFYDAVLMEDNRTLADYEVKKESTLVLNAKEPTPAVSGDSCSAKPRRLWSPRRAAISSRSVSSRWK